jgi:hypothetical protein
MSEGEVWDPLAGGPNNTRGGPGPIHGCPNSTHVTRDPPMGVRTSHTWFGTCPWGSGPVDVAPEHFLFRDTW